jgi:hypothetical protein
MDEKSFQDQVVALAHVHGYVVAHFRAAQNSKGNYRTPVAYDAKGFPDLVMVRSDFNNNSRPHRLIFAELKSNAGRLSKEQATWIDDLATVAETYVWRPRDWDDILEILR